MGKVFLSILTAIFFSFSANAQWKTDTTNVSSGFSAISFVSSNIGYAANSSNIYKTFNSGKTWSNIKPNSSYFIEDIQATSKDSAFATSTYGYIYYTYNSGQTWDSLYLDSTYNLLKAYSFSHDSLWFLGYNFNNTVIYKTGDGCQTFKTDTVQGLIAASGIDVMDNGKILISGIRLSSSFRCVYFSDNNGNSWNPLLGTTPSQGNDITSFNNYQVMHTGSFGNVYASRDSGQTFFSRSPSNSVTYTKIVRDSLALAFHGGSNYPKIYRSQDVGDTWTAWNFPFTGNISDAEQPFKEYPEWVILSVNQYPYLYTYCDEAKINLQSSLGFNIYCGDTTEISSGKHYKYTWSTGDTSKTIKVTNPGNYWAIAENICGNKDTVNFSINEIPIPIQVSNDTVICEGDSITLLATGGNQYSWFDMTSNQLSTDSFLNISPTQVSDFGVLIFDTTTQCFNGDTIQIDITSKVTILPTTPNVCIGGLITLNADTGLGYLYNWGAGPIANQYSINFPVLKDTTIRLISSYFQCQFEDSIKITVGIPNRNGNKNLAICSGDTLIDTLTNGIATSIIPSQFGSILPNGLFAFYPDSNTFYEIDFVDSSGCSFKDSVFVSISSPVKNGNKNLTFCLGDTLIDTLAIGSATSIIPSQFGSILPNNIFLFYPSSTTLFKLFFTDTAGCSFTDSILVTQDTTLRSEALGLAETNLGNPIQNGLAIMVQYNPVDSTVALIDSSILNTNGEFFLQKAVSEFYVKIIPDSSLYPNQLPTYFQNSLFFLSATSLNEQCKTHNIKINTIQGQNAGGPGFISGNVFQGAGKSSLEPWENLNIILSNSASSPIKITQTDSLGEFIFSNIPIGKYYLTVDDPKFNNAIPQEINLTAQNPKFEGGIFYGVNGSLALSSVPGYRELNPSTIKVFPNPSKGKVFIKAVEKIDRLVLMNYLGQNLKSWNQMDFPIHELNLESFPNGSYYLKADFAGAPSIFPITISK